MKTKLPDGCFNKTDAGEIIKFDIHNHRPYGQKNVSVERTIRSGRFLKREFCWSKFRFVWAVYSTLTYELSSSEQIWAETDFSGVVWYFYDKELAEKFIAEWHNDRNNKTDGESQV